MAGRIGGQPGIACARNGGGGNFPALCLPPLPTPFPLSLETKKGEN